MKLTRVFLRNVPGIDVPFHVDIPDANLAVLEGPNGIGKTTLCRTVAAILWPNAVPVSWEASAQWTEGAAVLLSELRSKRTRWTRDGNDIPAPSLPPVQLAACFTIRIDEMLQEQASDKDLADLITREMAGGFDLAALAKSEVAKPPTNPQALEVRNRASAAAAKLVQLELRQTALRIREEARPTLESDRAAARKARTHQLPLLEKAIRYRTLQSDIEQSDVELSALPANVGKLKGTEFDTVRRLVASIQKQRDECSSNEQQIAGLQASIDESAFPGHVPADGAAIEALKLQLDELRRCSLEADAARRQLAAAVAALKSLGEATVAASEDTGEPIPQAVVEQAGDLFAAAGEADARAKGAERVLKLLQSDQVGTGEAPHTAPEIEAAIAALASWCAQADSAASPAVPLWQPAALLALLLVEAVAAALVHPLPIWVSVIVICAGLAVAAKLLLQKPQPGANIRDAAAAAYRAANMPDLPEWTREAAARQIKTLARNLSDVTTEAKLAEQRKGAEVTRTDEVQKQAGAMEQLRDLYAQVGVSTTRITAGIVGLLDDLRHRRQARAAAAEADAALKAGQQACDNQTDAIVAGLARLGAAPAATDIQTLAATTADVEQKSRDLDQWIKQLAEANRRLAAGREAESAHADDLNLALSNAGCADAVELLSLEPLWPTWHKASQAKSDLVRESQRVTVELAASADLLEMDGPGLEAELAEANRIAQTEDELTEKIARLDADIDKEKHAHDQGDVMQELLDARQDEADLRTRAAQAGAAAVWLRKLETQQSQSLPVVARNASDLLGTFTRLRYKLLAPTGEHLKLRAMDTTTGAALELAQLSGGTRVQLLLAAKLAFANQAPGGSQIPIFLDEALRHSDPVRTSALVAALGELAAEGRQIIYLTNEPADFERMKLQLAPGLIGRVDLAAARSRDAGWSADRLPALPDMPTVPPPGDMNSAEYAELLAVPRLNPHAPVGTVHLYYALADDLKLLYPLIQAGIETVGQWNTAAESSVMPFGLTAAESSRVTARCALVTRFLQAWSIGRPKPLTLAALRDSAQDDQYSEKYWSLAEEQGLGGAELVKALRNKAIPGLREVRIASLESALFEKGCIVSEAPLSRELLCAQLVAQTDPALAPPQANRLVMALLGWAG